MHRFFGEVLGIILLACLNFLFLIVSKSFSSLSTNVQKYLKPLLTTSLESVFEALIKAVPVSEAKKPTRPSVFDTDSEDDNQISLDDILAGKTKAVKPPISKESKVASAQAKTQEAPQVIERQQSNPKTESGLDDLFNDIEGAAIAAPRFQPSESASKLKSPPEEQLYVAGDSKRSVPPPNSALEHNSSAEVPSLETNFFDGPPQLEPTAEAPAAQSDVALSHPSLLIAPITEPRTGSIKIILNQNFQNILTFLCSILSLLDPLKGNNTTKINTVTPGFFEYIHNSLNDSVEKTTLVGAPPATALEVSIVQPSVAPAPETKSAFWSKRQQVVFLLL